MNLFSRSLLGVSLALCAGGAALAAPTKTPVADTPATEIELVHGLGADKGVALQKLVDRFNASQNGPKIVIRDRRWNEGSVPHMMILGEKDAAQLLSGAPRYRPVFQVMKEAGERFDTLRPPAMMTPTPLDPSGRLIALPVALSTPVLYYNRNAFKDAGLNPDTPPETWQDLQKALTSLYSAGQACPYTTSHPAWILVENTSAWHNEPVMAEGPKNSLAINGFLAVKHVAMLSSWYKARYLQLFGRGDEAIEHFVKGECAVLTAPSAAWPTLKQQAQFEVGIGKLPYYAEYYGAPQNTLADGPALWVGAGKKPAEYKVVARFINHWLTGVSQVEWQRTAGYLPLNRAGLLASESQLLASDLVNIRVAVDELTHKPVTKNSRSSAYPQRRAVRDIIEDELEAVWADRKPSKLALDNAVERARALNCTKPSC